MASYMTVTVSAEQYEGADDCLAAAAAEYAEDHGLESWQVTASWAAGEDGYEDDERAEIALRVPVPSVYRACYWTSADRQGEVVLTLPDDAALDDDALMAVGVAEAERAGLVVGDGRLVVGEWRA